MEFLFFNLFLFFYEKGKGMQISFDSVSVEPFMRLYPFDSLSGREHLLTNCVAPHSHYLFYQCCSHFGFLLCLLIFERSSKNANTGNKRGDLFFSE